MPEPTYKHQDLVNTVLSKTNVITPSFSTAPSTDINIGGRYPVYFYGLNTEDIYGNTQGTGEKVFNGLVKMGGLAASTFVNGTLGLAKGIVEFSDTGKFSSIYDNDVTRNLDDWNKEWEDKYAHYKTQREQDSSWWEPQNLFSANFLMDGVIKNFGFALGALATGGAYSAALKGMGVTSKIIQAGNALEAFGAMDEGLAAASGSSRLSSLLQSVNRASKGIVSTIGRGIKNNADDFITSSFSSIGESGLEALNNSQEFRKNAIQKFEYDYGRSPNKEELQQIDQAATNVGNWSFGLNIGLLTATQYIQLPKIFSSSTKAERTAINKTIQNAEGFLEADLPKSTVGKLSYGAYKAAGLFFNKAEAFEEGAQFAIQKGTQDYYNKAYRGENANFWDSLGEGVKETLTTDEGLLNVFLGGFSGGLMTSGIVGVKDGKPAIGKTGKIEERGIFGFGGEAAKNTQIAIDAINKTRFKNVIIDGVNAANRAISLQEERVQALKEGNVLEAKDLENDYTQTYIFPRIKYGKKDLIIDDINKVRFQASTEEGFLSLQEEGKAASTDTRESFLKRLSNLEEQTNYVDKVYNNLKYQFEGIIDKNGEQVYNDKVIEQMTYAAAKVRDYNKRIQELQVDLQKSNVATYKLQTALNENSSFQDGKVKEAFNQKGIQSIIREISKEISDTDLNKEELQGKLFDYAKLLGRRQSYIFEYKKIKDNPLTYSKEEEPDINPSYKNKEGKEVIFEQGRVYKDNTKKELKIKEVEKGWQLLSPMGNPIAAYETEKEALQEKQIRQTILDENSEITFVNQNPDGTIKVIDKKGNIKTILPEDMSTYIPQETEVEKLAKNKKLKDKTKAVLNELIDDTPIDNSIDREDSDGFKLDISYIREAGTDPKYESTFYKDGTIIEFDNYHRRHQEFLFNLSKKGLRDIVTDLRIIPVTYKTQDFLKLNGIINEDYKDEAIRYVYVLKQNNKFFYVNKEGKKIGEVTKDTPNLNEAIFTYARRNTLTFGSKEEESYTNKNEYTPEQIQQIKDEWKQIRDVMLNFTPGEILNNLLEIKAISRGLPNILDSNDKNSIFDLGLITEDDLYKPIITVPAYGDVLIRGSEISVKMPLGKPVFNYEGNMFFINNSNISDSQASDLADLFEYLASQVLQGKEMDPKILYYISGVIRNSDKSGFESFTIDADENFSISIGKARFPIEQVSERKQEIKEALKNLYHHVNYKFLKEFEKTPTPFRVYSVKDGTPIYKEAPSYQHYLLQGSNPPLTTNLVKESIDIPIKQKYPIVRFDKLTLPIQPITEEKEVPKAETKQVNIAEAVTNLFENANESNTVVKETKNSPLLDLLKSRQESKTNPSTTDIEQSKKIEGKKGFFDSDSKFDNAAKRGIKIPMGLTGDITKEEAEIKQMLPQVNYITFKNIIQTTGGLRAWGAALPNFIYVWENAPYGTRYHEAFEQVFNYILSTEEQLDLYQEFVNREGSFTTFEGKLKNYKDATFEEAKEQMSDEFAAFKTNGVLPQGKKAKTFFQRLWEFIKALFLNTETLEDVFNKLATGSYASSVINTPANVRPQFKREVVNTPESLVQDTILGMTAEIFMKKWQDDVALISQLESNQEEAVKPLFTQLYNSLEAYFTSKEDNTLYAYFSQKIAGGFNTEEELLPIYTTIQQNWENVKAQWDNYTKDLKSFLKKFDIAFTVDDNGDVQLKESIEEDEENKMAGSDGYGSEDKLFVNAKNSASKIVKLLFATIADSEFVTNITRNALGNIVEKYVRNDINRDKNQMKLPSLVEYAKLFNYTLHNSANTNGIRKIIQKLSKKSQNTNIKINASLQTLLKRIKYSGSFSNLDIPTAKLVLKLENALSKQKPQFYKQLIQRDGSVVEVAINSFSRAQQLTDEWINNLQTSKYVIVSDNNIKFKPSINNKEPLIFLSNLGINITKEEFEALGNAKQDFIKEVNSLRESVMAYTKKSLPLITTRQTIGFGSNLDRLSAIYTENILGDTTESQHRNLDNKPTSNFILNNFVSTTLNDLDVNTLDEFKQLNPQFNDLYMGSSYLLNNVLFKDGSRTNTNIPIVITEGFDSSRVNPHHKLNGSMRLLNEINNNLNDKYFTLLPADAKTPWGVRIPSILPKTFFKENKIEALELYNQRMFEALKNEIALAKDFNNRNFIVNLNIKDEDGIEVGKQLRFFKTILSKELVDKIQKQYIENEGVIDTNLNIDDVYTQFKEELLQYLDNQVNKTINKLSKFKLITEKNGTFTLNGIDKNFLTYVAGKEKKAYKVKEETLKNIFIFREANYVFVNMELHKLFFNDPAQYKDPLKRIKSFLSGREYTHSDPYSDLNDFLNKKYNKQGDYNLNPTDYGYYRHTDEFTSLTLKDVKTYSQSYDSIKKAIGNKAKNYLSNDVADAQSWATGVAFREMLFKSGGRWEDSQEDLHQWLMAYDRQSLLKKGVLNEKNYSKQLRDQDLKTLEQKIPDAVLVPIKPIITGVSVENKVAKEFLYKTSTAPLYLYFVENTPMEKVYIEMMQKNINFLSMESAHKVGITAENTQSLYLDGQLKNIDKQPVRINYKYFGIQVETRGNKKKVTQGSQLTKLAVQNLMSRGVPLDYINENKTLAEDVVKQNWTNLSEEDKLKSKDYSLFKRHNEALINLALERSNSLFEKLGIKEGEFGYTIQDKKKVATFILNEVSRRELPNNIAEGIEVIDGDFKTPLEANANYAKIKEILYSTIENNLTRPKTSGSANILLSSLGFDDIIAKDVNGKKVLTTTKYKFYENEDGKRICQVALPFMFGNILPKIEKTLGKKFLTPKEGYKHVLDYLNSTTEGQSLLKGIGFRIPTQGLNSVDHFEIVEFLPTQMGKVAIFPAEITTKAGSDFDVDKINLYVKNFYLDAKGYPQVVPFFGYSQEAKQKLKNLMVDMELSSLISKEGVDLEFDDFDFKQAESKDKEEVDYLYLQSLENEYYNALEDIFSAERTFAGMVTPNDASQLEAISGMVKNQEIDNTNFANLLDSSFMTDKRQTFLSSKIGVGVAAVSNTNLALNQLVDFIIYPRPGQLERNFKVRFPYNEVNGGISLSKTQNKFGDWLSDLNSQVIDGTVDVSKKEWLPEMIGNSKNLNVLLFLFKAGVDPYTTALFLNQPAIKEFLVQREISETTSLVNKDIISKSAWGTLQDMQKKVISSKSKRDTFYSSKPEQYSQEVLEQLLNKDFYALTPQEQYLQLQILDDYYCFTQLAQDLFKVVQGYNIDTTRFTNPESIELKKLQTQEAYNLTNVEGQRAITTTTFLSPLRKSVMDTSEGLSSLFNTQKGEAKRVLNQVSIALKSQFYSKDDLVKYLQKAEQSIIDYVVNQNSSFKDIPIYKWSKAELFGTANIALWVKEMQKSVDLANNIILNNIETVIDTREGFNSYLKLKDKSYDSYTSDIWTASFRELRDSGIVIKLGDKTTTVGNLFKNIVISQILQNGMGRTTNSFLSIIPNEEVSSIAGQALSKIRNLNEWWEKGLFYRNNWLDDALVPEAPVEIVYNEEEDSYSKFIPKRLETNNRFMELVSSYNSDILTIPLFPFVEKAKYKTYPFIKITELETNDKGIVIDKKVKLYKRVQESGEIVLVKINKTEHALFKRVNKLGNENLKEYSGDTVSLLRNNDFIEELPDSKITDALFETGYSFSTEELTELIDSEEFEDSISEFEENNLPLQQKKDLPCEGGTSF